MATVNQTLSCTGTATPIVERQPTKTQQVTIVSIPILRNLPSRTWIVINTGSVSILRIPGKVLTTTATSTCIISLLRFGIDTFDIIEVSTKWFLREVDSVIARAEKRFGIMVRGRPSG